MTRIKICGITRPDDARAAADAGADAIGLVFAESPRCVTMNEARAIIAVTPPFVSIFGVFMNQRLDEVVDVAAALRIHTIQLHGREMPRYRASVRSALGGCVSIVKRIDVGAYDSKRAIALRIARHASGIPLLDPGAGDGQPFDWRLVTGLPDKFILSGGLTPQNVGAAIATALPFAVDVSSGVEKRRGVKDAAKMRAFVTAVRRADRACE